MLKSVTLPGTVTSIGNYAFYGLSGLTSITAQGVTSVGAYSFYNCTNLSAVSLPAATSIGGQAFNGCTNLVTVNLPAATNIISYAFYYSTNLVTVNIPSAESIGLYAFAGCRSLTSVYLGSMPPTIGGTILQSASTASARTVTFYAPSLTGYTSSPWLPGNNLGTGNAYWDNSANSGNLTVAKAVGTYTP
jgi:hypothetical protein